MEKYIDCDGVILDTETGLFDKYYELKEANPNLTRIEYLQKLNWNYWLRQAKIINNSIELLKFYDSDKVSILTKVHSLQEAVEKAKYFRELKIRNKIIVVPNRLEKNEIVSANGNILVDDSRKNLSSWSNAGGIPIHFCNSTNITEYVTVQSLEDILSDKILDNPNVKVLVKKKNN